MVMGPSLPVCGPRCGGAGAVGLLESPAPLLSLVWRGWSSRAADSRCTLLSQGYHLTPHRSCPAPRPALLRPQHYARQMDGLQYFLTYADNNAVGYFAKQSFTKTVTLEKDKVGVLAGLSSCIPRWSGTLPCLPCTHPSITFGLGGWVHRHAGEGQDSLDGVQKRGSHHALISGQSHTTPTCSGAASSRTTTAAR